MAELSRRGFLAQVAALAAASGLDPQTLGTVLSIPTAAVTESASTLAGTLLQGPVTAGQYRRLVGGPGEPYLPRLDVLGRAPGTARTSARRSLLYLGHLSDLHVIDSQSPARIEPMIIQAHSTWGSAFHPHDALTVHVVAAMTRAMTDLRTSPLTGAPMGVAVVTGDSADMHSHLELRWFIDLMDGVSVQANSGAPDRFEGVQAWSEAVWAYRPGDPAGGDFGDYGFPTLPSLLDQAIRTPVRAVGLPCPWYSVYGNHDTLLMGTFPIGSQLRALAIGGSKSYTLEGTVGGVLAGYAAQASPLQRFADAFGIQLGTRPGFRSVTSDPSRYLFEQRDFMAEHFRTASTPGPVGHGFTQRNLDTGETWWRADWTPRIRALGLDTCNQVVGPDGAVPDDQFRWLEDELKTAQAEQRLVVLLSHHNSLTLENRASRPGLDQRLHGAEELIELLLRYPVCVAWLNGHTHLNQILAHRNADATDGAGFWEITTASCIDFPQQQQVVELVDNRDGTMSIFTTVVDHASPATPGSSGSLTDLASQSRELAANDWAENPMMRRGSPLDRNTELLLRAPFDLSTITDADLESQHLTERTRLEATAARSAS